jgi:hypothetical protein
MEPLSSIMNVPLVPYAEWFARLRSTADFAAGTGDVAALKLLDLFQLALKPAENKESMGLLPRVVSDKGICASKILQNEQLSPVRSADVEKWVQYWRGVGFLPPLAESS